MKKRTLFFLSSFALVAFGFVFLSYQKTLADNHEDEKSRPTLSTMKLKDLDGNEVTLDHKDLSDRRVAFCFLTAWSQVSQEQAKNIARRESLFAGTIVFVCHGSLADVRALRQEFQAAGVSEENLWLQADRSVESDFAVAYDDLAKLDRVPALVIIDEDAKVLHASTGLLTFKKLEAALKSE